MSIPTPTIAGATTDLFAGVVGQDRAVALLRAAALRPVHAYLFVGPPGTGKRMSAIAFAAALLCPHRGEHAEGVAIDDSCRRVLSGLHPDVVSVEREGASIGIGAAREVTRTAFMGPVEGSRKVVILHDFHLVRETGPALLKTIEEPPPSTVFVILAEFLPPELVTIASRCVQVDFAPLSPDAVIAALTESGIEMDRARHLAEAAGGRLDRALLLASDPEFEVRRRAWHQIPSRLDGSGATAARIADELVALLDSSVAPLKARHEREAQELTDRNARAAEVGGSRGAKSRGRSARSALSAGVAQMEERHKREIRRQRTDELRAGLATLAVAYRERLAGASDSRRRADAVEAVRQIDRTSKSLSYNPGDLLALQALLARLGRIPATG